jgi:DNA segregation ATPase FtsK/SpoIIIE, S-DNA-T family
MSMTALMVTGGTFAAAGVMAYWRHLDAPRLRPLTPEQLAAAAPPELSTAVFVLSDQAQTRLMFGALGLGSVDDGFPKVESYDYTDYGLSVDVLMLGGQSLSDWTDDDTLDALRHYLRVDRVTAETLDPAWIRLQVRVFDTLAAPATALGSVPNDVDLEAVPVGVTEDFDTWRLRVLYSHILIAGAMGSGKGSVIWSLIDGMGPAIRDGLVDLWVIDPKGGMELGQGERLFVRFECTTPEGFLSLMKEAVTAMQERTQRLRAAGVRKLVPTTDEPLIVIIIDEAAALSAYSDRETRQEFERLLGLLLSQGRAVGVSVIAAVQDPSKETMPQRQLFPVRVGLRLDEPTQTAMVHGQGARDRGARCDQISDRTPGVAYVGEDGTTAFVRVRAYMVTDDDIDRIVELYAPRHENLAPQGDYSDFDPDDLGEDEGPVAA